MQFKHFNFKTASGTYVIDRSDGRRQTGLFKVVGKPPNICE
ncbi:MAG TPA: hypothetical protein VK699_10250 [Terriglobales bacterium]|nr:hypothetical protein [Terriglobales bacterium]